MLMVKIERETMAKAIDWYAKDNHGLDAVIADDEDLRDWSRWVLTEVSSYQPEELTAAGLDIAISDAGVLIAVQDGKIGADLLSAISLHIQ